MHPTKSEVARLMENPTVKAWIAEYTDYKGRPYPNCPACGWPHAPSVGCGIGAQFGTAFLGGHVFGIDASNVEYMLDLVSKFGSLGFHWRNETFFDVKGSNVVVTYLDDYNGSANLRRWEIPLDEWKSIADFIASKADTARQPTAMERELAEALHEISKLAPRPWIAGANITFEEWTKAYDRVDAVLARARAAGALD